MDRLDSLIEHVLRCETPERLKLFEKNLKLWVATVDMNNRPQHFDSFDTDYTTLAQQWRYLVEDIEQVEFYWPGETTIELPKPTKPDRKPVPPKMRFEIFERDGFRCQICGATAQDRVRLEIDHKIPTRREGQLALRIFGPFAELVIAANEIGCYSKSLVQSFKIREATTTGD